MPPPLLPPCSLFSPLLPLLSSSLPPPLLPGYPAVVAALPLLLPPPSLSTLPPPLPQYPVVVATLPSSRVSLAIVLTAVVTVSPPILMLLLPPCCPCPCPCCQPCRRCCCRAAQHTILRIGVCPGGDNQGPLFFTTNSTQKLPNLHRTLV